VPFIDIKFLKSLTVDKTRDNLPALKFRQTGKKKDKREKTNNKRLMIA